MILVIRVKILKTIDCRNRFLTNKLYFISSSSERLYFIEFLLVKLFLNSLLIILIKDFIKAWELYPLIFLKSLLILKKHFNKISAL